MGSNMQDYNVFINEASVLFEKYIILDSCAVDSLDLKRCKGSFIAIAGAYFLNRQFGDEVYQHTFNMVVLLDRSKRLVLPIVWLPCEEKPARFEHLYADKTCCLGLTHEVISIWGDKQLAKDFFDKIVDIFLINLLSFRQIGKCATEERPHAEAGIIDYYKDLIGMTATECRNALPYLHQKVSCNELAKGHNPCPCGGGKILRHCHGEQINSFLNDLYSNKELKKAFLQDNGSQMEKRKNG
jgi:hypothetical protein